MNAALALRFVGFFPNSFTLHWFTRQVDLSTSEQYSNHFQTLSSFFRPAIRDKVAIAQLRYKY